MNTLDGINIVGLTGQSGAGKSTASKFFMSCGISVIDCDKVSRYVSGFPEFLEEIAAAFPDCVDETGLLRQKLGAVVFNDRNRLQKYGGIIFPYITFEVFKRIRELKTGGERVIILDAPTLFESGLDVICSAVISVVAPFDTKLKRVLERDNIPVEFARSRLSSQHSEKFFYERTDYVIINDGDLSDLKENVSKTAQAVKERFNV